MNLLENKTKKQHYIPQVYLRGFSPQYKNDVGGKLDKGKYTIYAYDLKKNQSSQAIPIKSVCYEDYLYEIRNDEGGFVSENYLENFLKILENSFGKYRKKLERKAFLEENCFLTQEEKCFWVTYMIIQILRLPSALNAVTEAIKEHAAVTLSDAQAKNAARGYCLPFFSSIGEKEGRIIKALLEPMGNMNFGVGVDLQGKIITSDNPVYIELSQWPCDEYDIIIFPISAQLCLFLFGNENKKNTRKNFLFAINEKHREFIVTSLASNAIRKLYSNHELTEMEREYIKQGTKDREESEN